MNPFTPSDLAHFIEVLDTSGNFRFKVSAISIILAFQAFLRVSEVISLQSRDVVITRRDVLLTVRKAKRRPQGFTAVIPRCSPAIAFVLDYFS